jgi:succinate dehydrogenase/fumarate reductase cytochrome b subunit
MVQKMVVAEETEEITIPMMGRINAFLWILQRLTGIAVIFWMLLHTFSNYLIIQGKEVYEHEILFYHEVVPYIDLIYALLGVAIAWHAIYGLINIVRDLYSPGEPRLLTLKRKVPISPREISSPKNVLMWFKSGRRLPYRPIWSLHRVSAIILLFTVLIHFTWIHIIGGFQYYSSWDSVIQTFKNPIWVVFYLIFDFAIAFHGAQGIRIIITDFTNIEAEHQKAVLALSITIGVIGFLILAGIDIYAFIYVQGL